MGNCFCLASNNKIVSQNETFMEEERKAEARSWNVDDGDKEKKKKKKTVRFKLCESERQGIASESGSGIGVVRIRVVMSKEELKQFLNHNKDLKYSSVEQLVNAMRSTERRVAEVRASDGGVNGGWRPALESIPEDH